MFQILLFLGSLLLHEQASLAAPLVKGNCTQKCGEITIPFPFGIGTGCFLDEWYEIICRESGNSTFPVLHKANLRVLNISLPDWFNNKNGMINVSLPIIYSSNASCGGNGSFTPVSLEGSQFVFSDSRNVFVAVGCNIRALMQNTQSAIIGCDSRCGADNDLLRNLSCSGRDGCCQTTITSDLQAFSVDFQPEPGAGGNNECNYAFLGDRSQFVSSTTDFSELRASGHFVAVLEWGIANTSEAAIEVYDNSYYSDDSYSCEQRGFSSSYLVEMPFLQCSCYSGFTGNPYIKGGCEDINECEVPYSCNGTCVNERGSFKCVAGRRTAILIGFGPGLGALLLCLRLWRLYKYVKKRKKIKLKEKHFKCNGGLLLESELSSLRGNVEKSILFKSKDLEKAVDNFNEDRILEQGGQALGAGVGGLVQVLLLSRWLYNVIKKRREIKQKEKYFKTQWGLLWQQHLSSSPQGNVAKSKIFRFKDLEKATDRFHKDRILGRGGQGVVYKGMMTDGKIVAIKKSRLLDVEKVEEFINEVIILSQIDHRNVVKLMGCCLETDFPLLVYEFIPNGTLYQYLHDPNEDLLSSWDTRLRIATEIAAALFYLHSAASIPIYHRDIKSTNILLDEKYHAKVADFGISKSISLDETHVTTLVRGTFGYLDPEYFRTGHFTDKSDVYSFGVVLAELLTGQMPICRLREEEERSLAAYFVISMEQNCLFDVADARVTEEGKKEEIVAVANLARRCLSSIGRNRPTMIEVVMELEGIRKLQSSSSFQRNQGKIEPAESPDSRFASGKSFADTGVTTFSDVQPLAHWESW